MKNPKIITYFGKYSDADLEQKAELIADSMENNTHFPDPKPTIEELKAIIQNFDQAIIKAKEGGTLDRKKRDSYREELIQNLKRLARYVEFKADGNEQILVSSGYSMSKPKTAPIGILPKPDNFKAKPENSGTIKLRLKAIHGAHIYRYEYKKVDETDWKIVENSKSSLLLTDLESGQQYQFRVAGIGTEKELVYSDVISSYIL